MKLSVELRKKLEEMKNSIKDLQNSGKIDEAHAKLTDLRKLQNQIETQEELEKVEEEQGTAGKEQVNTVATAKNINKDVFFNKTVLGKPLTAEEQAYKNEVGAVGQVEAVGERGGYLVPVEQVNKIKELSRSYMSLKDYCTVIPVSSYSGNMPLEVEGTDELINFEELNEIQKSDIKFGNVAWKIKEYGDLIPVSNTLLEDTKINLMEYVNKRFARKKSTTENKIIIGVIKANTAATQAGKDHKAIKTALNKKLDTAIAGKAVILCNQTAFDYLDSLDDTTGRPLLTTDLQNESIKKYAGKQILVVDDTLLASPSGTAHDFYVGSIEELVAFFDRKQLTVEVSKEAGFTLNATYIKPIERFDVQAIDKNAMVKVTITPTV